MSFITELEKTNIDILDDQHRDIMNIINKYHLIADISRDVYMQFKSELNTLALMHFFTEEKLMKESNYENYYSHKLEHERFIRKVKEFPLDEKERLFNFLRDWLSNHLRMKDIMLGTFLLKIRTNNTY